MRVHGTLARYKSGCKCEECRAANAEYVFRTRRGLPGKPRSNQYDESEHGNRSKYGEGCRCVLCKIAHSQYQAGYAAGQRRARKEMKMAGEEFYDETYGGLLP